MIVLSRQEEARKLLWLFICIAALIIVTQAACRPPKPAAQSTILNTIPVGKEVGLWKVLPSEEMKFQITAPNARQVKVLYQPLDTPRRHAELGTVVTPDEQGNFLLPWKPNPDFTGDVWAEATWPDGTTQKSNVLALASEEAISLGGDIPLDSIGNSAETHASARSDKLTGGKIEQASLVPGDHRIWITVDVPAFRLTLWQNRKEVKSYQIGVGQLKFPLPINERKATEIIWNPDWIPPASKWVTDVVPGEKIEADDPRNPLGKIKIRLGNAILIHEAAKPSDIGSLVSHGCVRMRTEDLFDLTEKIVAARKLPITQEQIEQAKTNTERLAVKLDPPLWVDVNYDTQVIEGGVLHLYPDVYKRDKEEISNLQQELASTENLQVDAKTLQKMLEQVTQKQEFVVSIAKIKAGRALVAGRQVPLVNVPEPSS